MPSQKKTLAPISEWFAGSFRLSVFPTTATAFDASEWWSEVTGEKPRQTTFQAQAASRVDQGLFGGIPNAVLILTSNPLRIDWIYGIQDQFDFTGTDGIKSFTLGSVLEALEVFDQISSKWFSSSSFPAINRLAFGAQLLLQGDSDEDVYNLLSKYVPLKVKPGKTSDFLYQINRHKSSNTIKGLQINRLMKWSAAKFGQQLVSPNNPIISREILSWFACHLELDINTDPLFAGELPKHRLEKLLKELVDLGLEIASRGDSNL